MDSNQATPMEAWARLAAEKKGDTIFAMGLGVLLYAAFGLLDWFIFPGVAPTLLGIRAVVVAVLLTMVVALLASRGARLIRSQLFLSTAILIPGAGIVWMNVLVAGLPHGATYYAGLILVIALGFLFVPTRFRYTSMVAVALIVGYDVSLLSHDVPLSVAISNNFFLISAAVICGMGCLDNRRLMFQRYRDEEVISAQKAEVEAHRRRADHLLHQILPDPIAARLLVDTGPIADGYSDVTVLFADLAGFTEFSASVSPRSLVRYLNQIFSAFDEVAARLGVEKIKTIGDAYMAACGLPNEVDDHPERMVRMAIGMRDELERIRSEVPEVNLDVRIGINTGPCVAGVIGRQRFIYDLWGDTVNLASRMQSTGIAGNIQVSEATYLRVRQAFEFEAREDITVKGRGRMKAYLLCPSTVRQDRGDARGVVSPPGV